MKVKKLLFLMKTSIFDIINHCRWGTWLAKPILLLLFYIHTLFLILLHYTTRQRKKKYTLHYTFTTILLFFINTYFGYNTILCPSEWPNRGILF